MYYIYGVSVPSVLIESTDSMIVQEYRIILIVLLAYKFFRHPVDFIIL